MKETEKIFRSLFKRWIAAIKDADTVEQIMQKSSFSCMKSFILYLYGAVPVISACFAQIR